MRLTAKLVRVAALVAAAAAGVGATAATAGCGGSSTTGADGGIIGCGGCGCGGGSPPTTVTVTAAQACQMIEESYSLSAYASGATCRQLCANSGFECELPQSYAQEVQSLNPDAGSPPSDGGLWALDCPTGPATMTVTCIVQCTGRLTEGYGAPAPEGPCGEGERLAAMAYLEAVSVHAFERLERELDAHGAPSTLLREARRARRDEERHTDMTALLARHRGVLPRMPEPPQTVAPARTLFEVALENAVEGCIRETYGAVQGLVEARTSRDATMRRAMQSIATDECRHAELAWAVHAWAMPRLTEDERRAVECAMKDAVAEIASRDPRTASVLFIAERTAIA
jgi:hypothetical protein